jgi:hypothetical protein
MSQRKFVKRLDCDEILKEKHLWALNEKEMVVDEKLKNILDSYNVEKLLSIEFIIKSKLKFKNESELRKPFDWVWVKNTTKTSQDKN